ncbi:hypothetical protein B0A55_07350 [Friedmanniomyces simplex]|uniref:Required for respiratory growth protein 7, mitochondrial n=1 Tax=Friedmanniomyces simplex TaxID=329884 RepID=A0A4U0WWP9_9PEZI|nr:hypothetical protein B0A55_07350 [Friedmanniomyces simplex]
MLRSHVRPLTSSLTQRFRYALSLTAAQSTAPQNRPASSDAPRVAVTRKTVRVPKQDALFRPDIGLAERQAILDASIQAVKKPTTKSKRTKATTPASKEEELAPSEATEIDPPKARKRRTTKVKTPVVPPRLLPPTEQKHHDLPSFLAHVSRSNLSTTSSVYKGTHFEYTVAAALQSLNFTLQRTGRSNDLGIDLVGHWSLPAEHGKKKDYHVPVLVQCKAARPTPAMIRELEGAYTGAPAGWRGDGVLALLANVHPSTKGVREAVQRSRWPLGVLQVTREGEVKQFLWNAVAVQVGLEGLGVAVRYASKRGGVLEAGEDDNRETASSIGLTWLGKVWRPAGVQLGEEKAGAMVLET